jgi:prepilin-type N-terminal cleavage/methylation domain-containing protein
MNNFFRHPDFEKRRMPGKSGLTLIELLVVIGIVAAVVAISLPAINAMQKSFDSTGAEGMISAALSTARTLAISRQKYVGVRFQASYDPANVLDEDQYMIFIVLNKDKAVWDCGFVAVEGYKPMKLPENVGVIDKLVRRSSDRTSTPKNCGGSYNEDALAGLGNIFDIVDTSSFSIVFSPAGKLVIHEVRCRNKNNSGDDVVFNTYSNVTATSPTGMFVEDNHDNYGIGVEKSRNKLYIYDREKLRKMIDPADRWNYIKDLPTLNINPYTGGIIE